MLFREIAVWNLWPTKPSGSWPGGPSDDAFGHVQTMAGRLKGEKSGNEGNQLASRKWLF